MERQGHARTQFPSPEEAAVTLAPTEAVAPYADVVDLDRYPIHDLGSPRARRSSRAAAPSSPSAACARCPASSAPTPSPR
jgi:hypothetical protein